jgi:hypothetical protein
MNAAIGTKRMAPALCPYCGALLDAVTGVAFDAVATRLIQPGDRSVCAECLGVLQFDGRFYRRVSVREAKEVYARNKLLRDFRDARLSRQITSKTGKAKGGVA